jgi:hypothetical protein
VKIEEAITRPLSPDDLALEAKLVGDGGVDRFERFHLLVTFLIEEEFDVSIDGTFDRPRGVGGALAGPEWAGKGQVRARRDQRRRKAGGGLERGFRSPSSIPR